MRIHCIPKTNEVFEHIQLQNFDLQWKNFEQHYGTMNNTMVLWKKLRYYTKNYGTLIYNGKNYGKMINNMFNQYFFVRGNKA